ncbi:MAG: type II secretion system F family protein, partial [Planctomycetota bacterium]
WWAVLIAGAGGLYGWKRLRENPSSRLRIDRFALKIPVLGALLRDVSVARFTRTLGTLTAAGLPVLGALRITRAVLGNKAIEQAVSTVIEDVGEGATIAQPMQRAGVFPPLLVQVVGVGERTGELDTMLMRSAHAMEIRVESAIKLFTAVLQPLLIVFMACIVGVVLLAVLLPLLQLQESVGV